jgi:enolase
MHISDLSALEILDSRGLPTVEVRLRLGERTVRASVPAGKSTGAHEARELRDGDTRRYGGRGVLGAVANITNVIAPALVGRSLPTQEAVDALLIQLDGTSTKDRLGANAVLAVSLVVARAWALLTGLSLYESLGGPDATLLPVPCFNVINGGAHASNPLAFQEFMIVPAGVSTYAEAVRAGSETYHALARELNRRGQMTAVGDEGGFAPMIEMPHEALDLLVDAIERAGYQPGHDIWLALDPAASGFYREGRYRFANQSLEADGMIELYQHLVDQYPIVSIEDGLAEDDETGWQQLTATLGNRVQLVGDDLFVSDPRRVLAGIHQRLATAVLLKPNQIGTVTEITKTARIAHDGGWTCMMSHRSGETDDAFIADLAVALGTGQIKAGAPARGERVAKYNELLRIEQSLEHRAQFAGIGAFRSQGSERGQSALTMS